MNKSKKEKIVEKSLEIALNSSVIGLPNIIRSEKFYLRFMWTVLFTLSSAATIGIIAKEINSYFDYEVVTNINVYKQNPAEFPAISFNILRNGTFNISLNETLKKCQFNNKPCNSSDFDMIQDQFGQYSYRFSNKKSLAPVFFLEARSYLF